MSHRTVTPDLSDYMPRQQGLLLRGNRWSSNIKVPLDLQAALGKTHIRETLGTSDFREACTKISYERARATALFEDTRKKLTRAEAPAIPVKTVLVTVSDKEAFRMCARYLASREHMCKKWMSEEGQHLDPHERAQMASNVQDDAFDLRRGEEFRGKPLDGTRELRAFLKAENIECADSSPAFQTLRSLFLEAHLEYLGRYQDVIKKEDIRHRNPTFQGIHLHSPVVAEAAKEATIDDLMDLRARDIRDRKLSQKTAAAFQQPARLLREFFGGGKQLSTIQRADVLRLFDLLKPVPSNATKRYKGLTLAQAAEAADKKEDTRRLSATTLENNRIQITAIFNLAVEEKLMSENPCRSRLLRGMFDKNESVAPREQFTIAELNRLFSSKLHIGHAGNQGQSERPVRTGRFWVPLLALFHGMRCNEASQLYTEDVKTCEGITYISIREEREDGSKCDKKLKTKQSRRDVPLHPELKRLGFLEFVEERRRDTDFPHLFAELKAGHNGYFSDAFSKWFSRFVKHTLGNECEATMHSFRHQFRDATRAARLPAETVARLAGWEDGEGPMNRQMSHYGRGPEYLRILAEDIAKVNYPGLDLTHLYAIESLPKTTSFARLGEG